MRAALVLLLACTVPTAPDAFTPPAIYRAWYDATQDCAGVTPVHRYEALRFHVADFPPSVLGYWAGRDIYLARDMIDWGPAVRHEMLHAILGEAGHPPAFTACAGFVA